MLYDIPAATKELAEGVTSLPAGTLVGKNSGGKTQYNGPCPPKGSAHTYIFTLYALDSKLKLPAGAEGPAVMAQMKNHVVEKTQITAVYSRWAV